MYSLYRLKEQTIRSFQLYPPRTHPVTGNINKVFWLHLNIRSQMEDPHFCNKANRTLGFLLQWNLNISSRNIKEQAYKTLVRPQLDYSSTVWDPYQKEHIDLIERMQWRAARYVMGKYRNRSSVGDMLQQLEWKISQTRRRETRLTIMYKIINDKVVIKKDQHFMKPNRTSRHNHSHNYAVPSA